MKGVIAMNVPDAEQVLYGEYVYLLLHGESLNRDPAKRVRVRALERELDLARAARSVELGGWHQPGEALYGLTLGAGTTLPRARAEYLARCEAGRLARGERARAPLEPGLAQAAGRPRRLPFGQASIAGACPV